MLLLASTSDELRVVTSSAASIDVHASWADYDGSAVSPGRTNTLISTATTTTVVASPASSTFRTVKKVSIRNRHATLGCRVTVIHRAAGPTDAELISAVVPPGASLEYDEHHRWYAVRAPWGYRARVSDLILAAPTAGQWYTQVLAADVVNANATANRLTDVKALGFYVTEGHRYHFRYVLMYTAAATTTGSRWSIYGPGSPTALRYQNENSLTTTTKTSTEGHAAYDLPAASNASSAATGSNVAFVVGFVDQPTCDGLVFLRFASEIAGSGITLKAGSVVQWQRVT